MNRKPGHYAVVIDCGIPSVAELREDGDWWIIGDECEQNEDCFEYIAPSPLDIESMVGDYLKGKTNGN